MVRYSHKLHLRSSYKIFIITNFIWFFSYSCITKFTKNKEITRLYSVIELIKINYIKSELINWSKVEAIISRNEATIISTNSVASIISIIVERLPDKHSRYYSQMEFNKLITKNINFNSRFSGTFIDSTAIIYLNSFNTCDTNSLSKYADSLQSLIRVLDKSYSKGWILDFRDNTGGNCWPMIAGLGPLLGNGICGKFIYNDKSSSTFYYQDGISGIDSLPCVKLSKPFYKLKFEKPIAIIVGPNTASSGEIITIAFIGKQNVKIFGQPTHGFSTSNSIFVLNDSSVILLTTSIVADRKNHFYGHQIIPNQHSEYPIQSALNWINKSN